MKLLAALAIRPDYGAVAAHVRNREIWKIMSGFLTPTADNKYDLPPIELDPFPPETGGLMDIDFCHAACTLYRAQALRDVQPRFEIRELDNMFWWWDVALSSDLRNMGWKIGLERGVRALHCTAKGEML